MIFVSVGTHEQQFNRLVKKIDDLCINGDIDEDVFIQTGYSDYEPKSCKWKKMCSHDEIDKYNKEARIIITHGGPSSFVTPLQLGKVPIVVPRKKEFDEHVNNHQIDFCKEVYKRTKSFILIEDIDDLKDAILNYDEISNRCDRNIGKNNSLFCEKFSNIVDDLFND